MIPTILRCRAHARPSAPPGPAAVLGVLLLVPLPGAAQETGSAPDTVTLGALHRAAMAADPRLEQLELRASATELRIDELRSAWWPQLAVAAEGTLQSDVPSVPLTLPDVSVPEPPAERYRAALELDQLVYDAGATRRSEAVERVALDERRAEVRTELYRLRAEVDRAYFSSLLLEARAVEAAALVEDLEARLALVRAQAAEGAALPADTAALRAELLEAEQRRLELTAERRAARAVLRDLTGRAVDEDDVLAPPELTRSVERAMEAGGPAEVRRRPEYDRFDFARDRLANEAERTASETSPRIRAFGRAGWGRPGLDFFADDAEPFWTVGVRVRWQPWDRGAEARERRILELERRVLDTEEAAFTDRLEREIHDDLEAMEQLRTALELDDEIVTLREQVERRARAQLRERAVPPSVYVEARNDLLEARVARERHRLELARVHARYLRRLGIEIP